MPLDNTDYDRIEQIISRSLEPINANLKLMMPKDESLTRHLATAGRVDTIEQRVSSQTVAIQDVVKWAMSEHEKLRASNEARFDKLGERIDSFEKNTDENFTRIREGVSENRATTLRYIISVIVSFVVGSGALGLIEFALHH